MHTKKPKGVYLKSNAAAVARHGLPPPHLDLGLRFVEAQLAAVAANPSERSLWPTAYNACLRRNAVGVSAA